MVHIDIVDRAHLCRIWRHFKLELQLVTVRFIEEQEEEYEQYDDTGIVKFVCERLLVCETEGAYEVFGFMHCHIMCPLAMLPFFRLSGSFLPSSEAFGI
jgi:DNA-directed RNA polymerase subunit N (RpoN/RPB10)